MSTNSESGDPAVEYDLKLDQWIAIGSAAFAFVSAMVAGWAAWQAKRQADAVLGEAQPSFSVYQRVQGEVVLPQLVIEVVNHNRRPILLHRLALEYDREAVLIYPDKEDDSSVLAGMIAAARGEGYEFKAPLRLRGCGVNMEPAFIELFYCCTWHSLEPHEPASLGVKAEFSFDGVRGRQQGYGATRLHPPHDDWTPQIP